MLRKPRIYIAAHIPKEAENYISQYCDYEKWEGIGRIPKKEFLRRIHDKEGILLSGIPINKELLDHAPNLRAVSNISVGYNNFDIAEMKSRGIIGTNTPEVLDDSVADLIFGLILSAARRIPEMDSFVKAGKWKSEDDKELYGVDVHHGTLGIIGMGRIGEAVAKRARLGFDMEVLYYNRNRRYESEKKLGVRYRELESLLKESDFIVLMTPLTNETFHLIDYKEFALMRKGAFFINASRGKTVNEEALIDALCRKKIAGAGLDVFEKEPVSPDNPLLKMPNVVTLPHIGSATEKTRFDMAMLASKNLVAAVLGERPPNIVPELDNFS